MKKRRETFLPTSTNLSCCFQNSDVTHSSYFRSCLLHYFTYFPLVLFHGIYEITLRISTSLVV
jgi:hypothetical protein